MLQALVQKSLGSREAMDRTALTEQCLEAWPGVFSGAEGKPLLKPPVYRAGERRLQPRPAAPNAPCRNPSDPALRVFGPRDHPLS